MRGAIAPLLQYVFMGCFLVKHRENYTLPYLTLTIQGEEEVYLKNGELLERRMWEKLTRVGPFSKYSLYRRMSKAKEIQIINIPYYSNC
jgi:hypothetical protein